MAKRSDPRSKSAAPSRRSEAPVESRSAATWTVPPELDGALLDRVVREKLGDASWNQVRSWIVQGKVSVNGQRRLVFQDPIASGDTIEFSPTGQKKTEPTAGDATLDPLLVYQDSQVVVVDKPSGIATVPFEGSERDSLDRRVASLLGARGRAASLHVVHRLDKETSGLLVFARTNGALLHLKNQFRFHTTHRRYLALVHGSASSRTYSSRLVQDRGDGLRGSTTNPKLGREAITHVRVLHRFRGATLVECQLETGRTHQIRIHLSEAGHPLVGERVYVRNYPGELLVAPRVLLHAAELGFDHPSDGRRLEFKKVPPDDFRRYVEALSPA